MVWGRNAAVLGLVMLGACTQLGGAALPPVDATVTPPELEFLAIRQNWDRAFERSFTEAPFRGGALAVVAPDDQGEPATYALVPCRDGRAVCAGGPGGPAGQVRRSPDWTLVEGLYGRRFWLSHGGDGYVERGGRYWPLAWDARVNGTGDGSDPALETPYPHGRTALGQPYVPPGLAARIGGLGEVDGTVLRSTPVY